MSSEAMNPFGHVDMRVTDMAAALAFYSAVMPALGFGQTFHSTEWKVWVSEGTPPSVSMFAITGDPTHRPNANRVAFWAKSQKDVERLAEVVRQAGGRITSGPKLYPEYRGAYFAFFFEDPSGNRFEVVHRTL